MKKVFLAVLILTSLMLTILAPSAFALMDTGYVYSDISGKWFTDAVMKYGYPDIFSDGTGKYSPNMKITRIEFVRLLHKALGVSINYFAAPDVKDSFNDMENTDTGVNELIDLVTTGIIEKGGSFHPGDSLDRDVMIHWIMNALNYETDNHYPIPMVSTVPFGDDGEIKDAYRNEIYSSVILKLVKGRGNNLLFPNDGATRAEAVTIVSRLMTLLDSYKSGVDIFPTAWLAADGSLTMSLTILNNTDKTVTISHTSGQKYDFKLFDAAGNNLYTWSAGKLFIMVIGKTEIGPGEEIVFSDQLDWEADSDLNQAVLMKAYIVGASDDFMIDTNGYAAVIAK